MSEAATLEIDEAHLRGWIGREEVATDLVSADLVAKFNATFDVDAPFPPRERPGRVLDQYRYRQARQFRVSGRPFRRAARPAGRGGQSVPLPASAETGASSSSSASSSGASSAAPGRRMRGVVRRVSE